MTQHSRRLLSLAFAVAAIALPGAAHALPKALLCYADAGVNAASVASNINPGGAYFAVVDILDCARNTPTLQQLKGYDAVMLWSSQNYLDRTGLGNNLADYVDAGGGVVQGMFNFYNSGGFGLDLQGRWSAGKYNCINSGNQSQNVALAVQPKDPNSPLVTGVTKLNASNIGSGGLAVGATSVWDYNNGQPAIATCQVGGRNRVDLNFYLNPGAWTGDGYVIMRNAMVAIAGGLNPLRGTPSPVAFPSTGTGGVSAPVTVTFTNSSMLAATAKSLAVTGANAAEFSVVKQPQFPVTLQAGQTFTVDIAFAPATMGARTATLVVDVAVQQGMMAPPPPAQVTLNGTGVGAKLAITPNPVNCGGTQVGVKIKKNVTVSNGGGGKIQISAMSVSGPAFVLSSVPDLPLVIGNGGAFTVVVEFTPAQNGITSDTLVITTNDPNTPTLKVPVSGFAGPPAIALDTNTLAFGNINVGARSQANTVNIQNAGFSDLTITGALMVSGNNPGDFLLAANGIGAGTVIPAQSSLPFTITFTPQLTGQRDAQLVITSSDVNTPTKTLKLFGTGTQATLTVTPKVPLDFGLVRVQTTSKAQDILIAASGTGAIKVQSVSFSGPNASVFTQTGGQVAPFTIAANAMTTVSVACKPDAIGALTGSADIVTDVGNASVALKCAGTSPRITVTPNFVDFGTVPLNMQSPKTHVTIANNGSDTLELKDISIDGIDSGDFVSANLPAVLPVTIAPAMKIEFDVLFVPTNAAKEEAAINFYTDDPLLPQGHINLVGVGATTGLTVGPQPLDFGMVLQGTTAGPLGATVTNKGDLPLVVTSVTVGAGGAQSFRVSPTVDMASPVTLAPGQSFGLAITFTPNGIGNISAPMIVAAQGVQSTTITLKGVSYLPMLQFGIAGGGSTLDFGTVTVGKSSDPIEVRILNSGSTNATLDRIVSDNPQFVVDTSQAKLTLAPKDTTSIFITYSPTKVEDMASAKLAAYLPGATVASATLKLTGASVPSDPQMNNNDTGCSVTPRGSRGPWLLVLVVIGSLLMTRRRRFQNPMEEVR